ncbi:PQQ-binding-like beta-propeller repeat protein [Dactylosporangium sp. NPDC000244]|uniref:outer membrane protein assembly factor BamB family protein n=1 Tax=Dactylosporangium sp. NPDC000244 TaxID=3154365 RepID=UPI00331A66C2
MSLIDLGDAGAWSPPDEPVRRGRGRLAAAVVAVLAAALLVADGPRDGRPLFTLEDRVLDAQLAGGLLFVSRFEDGGPGRFEARTVGGRMLWSRPRSGENEGLAFAAGEELMLTSAYGRQSAQEATATALDRRTGAQLWHRSASVVIGSAGPVVVLEDVDGVTQPYTRVGTDTPTRVLGVDPRTGATAWEQTLPAGSLVSYDGSDTRPDTIGSIDELTAGGTLQRRDPVSGAVTTRTPLAGLGGNASDFTVSGDRVVVGRIGLRGADVYDLASGRLLWRLDQPDGGPFPCGPERWCAVGGDGIHGLDAASGRRVWDVGQYNDIFNLSGDLIVAGGLGNSTSLTHEPVVLAIDARTGVVTHRLTGWVATYIPAGPLSVVTHTDAGQWQGLVGLYDPRTGHVRVIGRGRLGPVPRCRTGEGVVVCLSSGLSVWRLP